jgi:hypothetical protein
MLVSGRLRRRLRQSSGEELLPNDRLSSGVFSTHTIQDVFKLKTNAERWGVVVEERSSLLRIYYVIRPAGGHEKLVLEK